MKDNCLLEIMMLFNEGNKEKKLATWIIENKKIVLSITTLNFSDPKFSKKIEPFLKLKHTSLINDGSDIDEMVENFAVPENNEEKTNNNNTENNNTIKKDKKENKIRKRNDKNYGHKVKQQIDKNNEEKTQEKYKQEFINLISSNECPLHLTLQSFIEAKEKEQQEKIQKRSTGDLIDSYILDEFDQLQGTEVKIDNLSSDWDKGNIILYNSLTITYRSTNSCTPHRLHNIYNK